MFHTFFQAICRVGIFVICAKAILQFRAQETYEKYIRLLVGVMILIQLFLPLGSHILGRGGQETAEILEQFKQGLEEGMKNAEEKAAAADALLEQMTLEEVRRRMEEQMEQEGETKGEGTDGVEGTEALETQSADISVAPVEPILIEPD